MSNRESRDAELANAAAKSGQTIEALREARTREWLDNAYSYTEKLGGAYNLQGIDKLNMFVSGRSNDLLTMLEDSATSIDQPLFKMLAKDLIGVFGEFYLSDQALCCLVKNILMQTKLQGDIENFNARVKQIAELELNGVHINEGNFALYISETQFGKSIDRNIAVIDIIITFLDLEISDITMPIIDFIREISEAAAGFLAIALQQLMFTIRDSGIEWIIDKIDEKIDPESAMKCLPYLDFIKVLKKYINDYGLTAKLNAVIQGWLGQEHAKFKKAFESDFPKHIKEIEMLNYVRGIFYNIKNAIVSWEFCVFMQDSNTDLFTEDGEFSGHNPYYTYMNGILNTGTYTAQNKNSFSNADDGTVFSNSSNNTNTNDQNGTILPSNDELKAFLINRMNMSPSDANNLMSDANNANMNNGDDSIQNSCSVVLEPNDIFSIIDDVIKQSRNG